MQLPDGFLTYSRGLPSTARIPDIQVTAMSSLIRRCAVLVMAALAITAAAQAQVPVDDFRVRQLESEVLRLQRALDAQARRIEMLEQAARITPPLSPLDPVPQQNSSPAWLVMSSWDRIKTGMTAQEVIAVLGRPTSSRYSGEGKLRLLYYAMEVGRESVLVGTIGLEDSGVVEINRPALKDVAAR